MHTVRVYVVCLCYGSTMHTVHAMDLWYMLFILSISTCDVCTILLLILLQSTRCIRPSLTDMIILSVVILYILSIHNTCYKCHWSIMHIHAIDLYASYVYSYHHVLSLFRLCDPLYLLNHLFNVLIRACSSTHSRLAMQAIHAATLTCTIRCTLTTHWCFVLVYACLPSLRYLW